MLEALQVDWVRGAVIKEGPTMRELAVTLVAVMVVAWVRVLVEQGELLVVEVRSWVAIILPVATTLLVVIMLPEWVLELLTRQILDVELGREHPTLAAVWVAQRLRVVALAVLASRELAPQSQPLIGRMLVTAEVISHNHHLTRSLVRVQELFQRKP